jgi:hypothetical protein
MNFRKKEGSYLVFTLTPEGIKPGKSKLKAIKDANPPDRHQDNQVLCQTLQLLRDPYQRFCDHCCTTVQINPERLRLQIKTSS